MAVRGLISNGTWTTGTWYRIEARSMDWDFGNNTWDALTTERIVNVTFDNAGNQVGIFLPIRDVSVTTGKTLTIKLQENVGGTWTIRTTDVFNEGTGNWVEALGFGHLLYFPLTSYAVSVAASTWRYSVQSSAGSGSYWARSSTASDWGYAVALNADTSPPSASDQIIMADGCTYTIDQDQAWGSGDSPLYRCFFVGSLGLLQWQNPPVASYTLTLGTNNKVWLAPDAHLQIGTAVAPIPVAQQAVIAITCSGAITASGTQFSGQQLVSTTIHIHGEEQSSVHALIATDAASGQPDVVTATDMSAVWSIGDTVTLFGKLSNTTDNVAYTITNIVGTTVTLSANLNKNVLAGGAIVNRNRGRNAGVCVRASGMHSLLSANAAHYEVTGVWFDTCGFGGILTTSRNSGNVLRNLFIEAPVEVRAGISCSWGSVATGTAVTGAGVRDTLQNLYYWTNVNSLAVFLSHTMGYCDCTNIFTRNNAQVNAIYLSGVSYTLTNAVIGPYSYNTQSYGLQGVGTDHTYTNVVVVGGTAGGHFVLSLFASRLVNCSADYCSTYNLILGNMIDVTFTSCRFGSRQTATLYDIYTYSGSLIRCVLSNSSLGTSGIGNSTALLDTSYLRFHRYNAVDNDHRCWLTNGYLRSVGDGLTDTTVHTSGTGKFAIRFESLSSTSRLEWAFATPTGNILGQTMTVAVWCKIANAAYYAGTHQKPRLTVRYDNATDVYAEATASTDWQLLSVTFVPTTSYGQITVTLSTMTDAVGSNAYVYFDDFAVLYPAGYKLDLGGLDLWADALPITPPIATVLSAGDVWTVPASGLTGVGSVGKFVTELPSASQNADAVLDEDAAGHTGWLTKLLSVVKFLGLK